MHAPCYARQPKFTDPQDCYGRKHDPHVMLLSYFLQLVQNLSVTRYTTTGIYIPNRLSRSQLDSENFFLPFFFFFFSAALLRFSSDVPNTLLAPTYRHGVSSRLDSEQFLPDNIEVEKKKRTCRQPFKMSLSSDDPAPEPWIRSMYWNVPPVK